MAVLRDFVRRSFLYAAPDAEIGADDPLLERGVIDSMGVVELIEFLQSEFGVTVADEDITEENLGSLRSIARYVVGRQQSLSTPGQKVPERQFGAPESR